MHARPLKRFAIRPDADGRRWSVVDKEVGCYARQGSRWLAGLSPHAAALYAAILNTAEPAFRRASPP